MRVELPRRLQGPVSFLFLVTLSVVLIDGVRAAAQTPAFAGPQTRLIVFAEHRMAEGEWTALFQALRRGLTGSDEGAPLTEEAVLVRGDEAMRRERLKDGIAVYLEGDCTLVAPPFYAPHVFEGRLGWVPIIHGRIQPYVHVNCDLLVQMLGKAGMRMNRERREAVMGEAMARVIEHEWIHYATQSAHHADRGISSPIFTMYDLLAEDSEFKTGKRVEPKQRGSNGRGATE